MKRKSNGPGIFGLAVLMLVAAMMISGCNDNVNGNGDVDNVGSMAEFNQCLADNGVIVYGTEWCPACGNLIATLGGYEAADPVYVECTVEQQRCSDEMLGNSIPEIQIDGEAYTGPRTLEGLSEVTGCPLPQ